jgi:hypothetical protein
MKRILYSLLLLIGFATQAQITNHVPWYKYTNKLSAGKFQLTNSGEYSADFTVPSITASVTLDTITEDRTVTFPDLVAADKGVTVLVNNTNSSAFAWAVLGTVRESNDGTLITTIGRGVHLFYYDGYKWFRQSNGGGGSGGVPDPYTGGYGILVNALTKVISLDTSITQTIALVRDGDSLYIEVDGERSTGAYAPTAGGGDTANLIMNNSGTSGERLFWYRNDSAFVKRLIAGTNITITTAGVAGSGDSTITINSSGGGGTPAGSTGQIQYNSSGAFAASDAYWSSSKLGINTSAPIAQFHQSVDGLTPAAGITPGGASAALSNSGNTAFAFISAGTSAQRGIFSASKSRGTLTSPTTTAASDYIFSILGNAYDGTALQGTAAIHFQVDGSVSSGTAGQKIVFRTGATNTASLADRMTISKSGVVNIANTSGTGSRFLQASSTGDVTATGLSVIQVNAISLDFASTSAQTSSELTVTATGAAVGDPVSLGLPAAPNTNSSFTAYVSAVDTVTIRFNNYSSGAIDPASASYKVLVFHY